jgi:hypothetical protein
MDVYVLLILVIYLYFILSLLVLQMYLCYYFESFLSTNVLCLITKKVMSMYNLKKVTRY